MLPLRACAHAPHTPGREPLSQHTPETHGGSPLDCGPALSRGAAGEQPHPQDPRPTGLGGEGPCIVPRGGGRRGGGGTRIREPPQCRRDSHGTQRSRSADSRPDLRAFQACKHSFVHALIHSFARSFVRLLIRVCIHSFTSSFSTDAGPGPVPGQCVKDPSAALCANNRDVQTQASTSGWLDQEDVVRAYSGASASQGSKGDLAVCGNVDRPRRNYAE